MEAWWLLSIYCGSQLTTVGPNFSFVLVTAHKRRKLLKIEKFRFFGGCPMGKGKVGKYFYL